MLYHFNIAVLTLRFNVLLFDVRLVRVDVRADVRVALFNVALSNVHYLMLHFFMLYCLMLH